MRAVIVDDEPLARRGIWQLLANYPEVEVVAECANGSDAVLAIGAHSPDLLFLDVQMPELDGFEVVSSIGADRMPAVVFITAYDEFALRAFEASAVDYLMKPVGPQRFAAAMQRIIARREEGEALRRVAELQTLLDRVAPPRSRLIVTTAKGLLRIDADEIDWISAYDYYAVLHVGSRRYLLRESLAALEGRLPHEVFIRVHRSAIVNCTKVRELNRDTVVLHDGTRVKTSRRRRSAVNAALREAATR